MTKNNKTLDSYEDFKKYSVEEISQMLGIGKTKTRELLQSKLLPGTKIGRDYFTSKTSNNGIFIRKCPLYFHLISTL